jgi:hypothetical protein
MFCKASLEDFPSWILKSSQKSSICGLKGVYCHHCFKHLLAELTMLYSYGGHYGPAFYNYFYDQNKLISNGTIDGIELNFNSLGIINGIIDEYIQAPYVSRHKPRQF